MKLKSSLQTWAQTHLLRRRDVVLLFAQGARMWTEFRAEICKKPCKKLHMHRHTFLVLLFICGFVGGALVKVVARETVTIGYDDYRIVADNAAQTDVK